MEVVKVICDDCLNDIEFGTGREILEPACILCPDCVTLRLINSLTLNRPFKQCEVCHGSGYRKVEVSFDGHRSDYETVECEHLAYKKMIRDNYKGSSFTTPAEDIDKEMDWLNNNH